MTAHSKSQTVLSTLLAILILALMGLGSFWLVKNIYRVLSSMNSDIAVAIIAAAATVLVAVISIVLGKIYEARTTVQKELRERKTPVYEEFITFIFRILLGEKTGNAPTEQEMIKFLAEYNQKMMVWGSDSVLREWSAWRRSLENHSLENEPHFVEGLVQYEKLILAIRKDLGHKNEDIGKYDILRLFINDLDSITKKVGS
jgi:hypothetical protein